MIPCRGKAMIDEICTLKRSWYVDIVTWHMEARVEIYRRN